MAVTIPANIRKELESQGAQDAIRAIEREERQDFSEYPKPSAADVLEWKRYLDDRFRPFWTGSTSASSSSSSRGAVQDDGGDSLANIRDMRYGRDIAPEKLAKRMEHTYRARTYLTRNEVDRVVALMGRNPLQVRVPQAGTKQDADKIASRQSEFCNALIPALDQQAGFGLIQRSDDALVEAGLVGLEFYLTGSYDDIDWDDQEYETNEDGAVTRKTETQAQKRARLQQARRQRRLPFGLRYVDPASVRFQMGEDDEPECALICEKKRWRLIKNKTIARLQRGDMRDKDAIPRPGDPGTHGDAASMFSHVEGLVDDVDTIRYYDKRWYAYVVAGVLVEVSEHGLPGVPVGIGTGRVTSSSNYGEMFAGITWGRTRLEQLINDLATITADVKATYNRPKIVAANTNPATVGLNQGQTFNLDLSSDDLVGLPYGYAPVDVFKDFRSTDNDGFLQFLLSMFQMGGMSAIAQGESPGSDVSGYLARSLQGAANAKYEGLLDNKCRLWRWVVDFTRRVIRDVIGEEVEIQDLVGDDDGGSKWLSLGPDDIDETPCRVSIDPLSEQDKMALGAFYMQGMSAGLVAPEEVARRVYGIQNWEQNLMNVAVGKAEVMLEERAVADAMQRVEEDAADRAAKNAPPPTILGPDGKPLPPSARGPAEAQSPTSMGAGPGVPEPPTVGAPALAAMQQGNPLTNPQVFRAGQRPIQQGLAPQEVQ